MLQTMVRTREEIKEYLKELKAWLDSVREQPVEGMSDFFSSRIGIYEDVHLKNFAGEYEHIASFFEDGLRSLLDIGCGTGPELESLFSRFPDLKVTGVDLCETMLDKLIRKYGGKDIEIIRADYFEYPYERNRYDAATSFETLHHFKYDKKRQIYDKLYHAIKPGGYYIECDYIACCDEEEAMCLESYEYRRRKNGVPDDAFVHIDIPITFERQAELMKNAGFKAVELLNLNGGTAIIKAVK